VLTVLAIPFFLPHMHDRYFFLGDTLTVALACCGTLPLGNGCSPQEQKTELAARIFAAVCVQFASLICYIAYFNSYYVRVGNIFLTNDRGAVAVILAILCMLYTLFLSHRQQKHL